MLVVVVVVVEFVSGVAVFEAGGAIVPASFAGAVTVLVVVVVVDESFVVLLDWSQPASAMAPVTNETATRPLRRRFIRVLP